MKFKIALFFMIGFSLSSDLQAYRTKEERDMRRDVVEKLQAYQEQWRKKTIELYKKQQNQSPVKKKSEMHPWEPRGR